MPFQVTRSQVDEMVSNFVEYKMDMFTSNPRTMKAVEEKVITAIEYIAIKKNVADEEDLKDLVEDLMICAVSLADKIGFTKIIYDFIFECIK